jgi:L-ribulokinase
MDVWRAGGIVVQFLPSSPEKRRHADLHPGDAPAGADIMIQNDDDDWLEARALVETVEDHELVDPLLTGLTIGQTLYTTPGEVYRTLIEATAFGALTIINRLEEYGVRVEAVVNCGGIAEKSPLVMQIYADICNRPMRISRSAQTCALGSAIFGSVVGGAHANVADAQAAMTGIKETVYEPNPQAAATYARIYKLYRQVHDAFGLPQPIDLGNVMKDLIAIRDEVRHVA